MTYRKATCSEIAACLRRQCTVNPNEYETERSPKVLRRIINDIDRAARSNAAWLEAQDAKGEA